LNLKMASSILDKHQTLPLQKIRHNSILGKDLVRL